MHTSSQHPAGTPACFCLACHGRSFGSEFFSRTIGRWWLAGRRRSRERPSVCPPIDPKIMPNNQSDRGARGSPLRRLTVQYDNGFLSPPCFVPRL